MVIYLPCLQGLNREVIQVSEVNEFYTTMYNILDNAVYKETGKTASSISV